MPHLIAVPVLLPMLVAALMLLLGEQRRTWKALLNILACALGLAVSVLLLLWVDARGSAQAFGVYLPANWPVPFGIVLVLDRLSALMLVLSAAIALAAMLYAAARWHRAGVHFHPLFQLLLMGLNGAFLTGDLFNLFVFFEVMLVASYGLLLHGSGRARVGAGVHYIAVNLVASSLFLIGAAMLYGITGTLNMADMARKLALIPPADLGLLRAGAAMLGLAFVIKAAIWPLNFWLVPAYGAASAPVGALFVLMTKVGLYAVLRVWTLLFPVAGGGLALSGVGSGASFGAAALVWGGLVTLALGALGSLAAQHLGRLAGYCTIVSAGTVLAAVGMREAALTAGALYYLVSASLAVSVLFLLTELIERSRQMAQDPALLDVGAPDAPFRPELVLAPGPADPAAMPVTVPEGVNLDDMEQALTGRAIPAGMAFLGLAFVGCALLVAGLPPLSGFVAKFVLLSALLNPGWPDVASAAPDSAAWLLLLLLIASGLASTIALARAGIRYFWAPQARPAPHLRVIECIPVVLLLCACVALTVGAAPVLRYTQAAAATLQQPGAYIDAVLSARPVPAPPHKPGMIP